MGVHAVPAVIKERHLTTRKVEALCGCFIHLPTGGLEVGGHLGNINLVCPSLHLSILSPCWSSCQEPYLATPLLLSYKIQTRPHHLLLTFKMETAPSFMHSTHTSDNCDLLPDQVLESGSQRTCSFIILGQLRECTIYKVDRYQRRKSFLFWWPFLSIFTFTFLFLPSLPNTEVNPFS